MKKLLSLVLSLLLVFSIIPMTMYTSVAAAATSYTFDWVRNSNGVNDFNEVITPASGAAALSTNNYNDKTCMTTNRTLVVGDKLAFTTKTDLPAGVYKAVFELRAYTGRANVNITVGTEEYGVFVSPGGGTDTKVTLFNLYEHETTGPITITFEATTSGSFYIEQFHFQKVDYLYEIDGSNIVLKEYIGKDTAVEIPKTIDGYTVVGVGKDCFKDNTDITSVLVPETVQTVGEDAFAGCSSLANITFYSDDVVVFDSATTISDTAVISGFVNSNPQAYAEKYGREFVEVAFAKIGDTKFPTLEAALNAAVDGDVIVILDELSIETKLTVDKEVTIDLAGNTINASSTIDATSKLILTSTKDGLGEEDTDTQATIKFKDKFVSTTADFYMSNIKAIASATGTFYTNTNAEVAPKFVARNCAFTISTNSVKRALAFNTKATEIDMQDCTVHSGDNHNASGFLVSSASYGTIKNVSFTMVKGLSVDITNTGAEGIVFDGCSVKQSNYDQGAVFNITGGKVTLTGGTVVDGENKPSAVLAISGGSLTVDGATIKGDKGSDANRIVFKISNSPTLNIISGVFARKADGSGKITNNNAKFKAGLAANTALYETTSVSAADDTNVLTYAKAVDSLKTIVAAPCEHYSKRLDAGCLEGGVCRYCNNELEANGHTPVYKHDKDSHWLVCEAENCEVLAQTGTEFVGEKYAHTGGTATCTTLADCVVCSTAYGETKPHTFTNYVKDDTHSCAHNTVSIATCDDGCGTKDYSYAEATDYVVSKEAKAPTCTEDGNSVEWKCAQCDTIIKDSVTIAKLGHTFGEPEVVVDSDYMNAGKGSHACITEDCGYEENIVIPVKTFKASTVAIVGDYTVEGTAQFSSLAAAFAAADEDDVVILIKATSIDESITLTKKATLDLNGKQLTVATESSAIVTNYDFELRNTNDGLGKVQFGLTEVLPSNPDDKYGTIADVGNPAYYVPGHYSTSGVFEANTNRIANKKLLAVEYGKSYTLNTGSTNSKLEFIIREYDENGKFVASKGGLANGTVYTPSKETVAYVSVAFWINGDTVSDIGAMLNSGAFTPTITTAATKTTVAFSKPFINTTATFKMSNIKAVASADTTFVYSSAAVGSEVVSKFIAKDCQFTVSGTARPLKFTNEAAIELDIQDSTIYSTTGGFEVSSTGLYGTIKNTKITRDKGSPVVMVKTAAEGVTYLGCTIKQNSYDQNNMHVKGGKTILGAGTQVDGGNVSSTVLWHEAGTLVIDGAKLFGDKGTDSSRKVLALNDGANLIFIKGSLHTGTANGAAGIATNNWTKLIASIQKGSWIYETAEKNGEFIYSRDTNFNGFKNLYVNLCDHYETTATCNEAGECVYCLQEMDPLGCDDLGFGSNDEIHWKECSRCGTKVEGTDEAHTEGTVATCTTAKRCEECKAYYGDSLGHDYSVVGHDKAEHWTECSRCQLVQEGTKVAHTGGTATCYSFAVCDECKNEYGDKLDHSWGEYKQLTAPDCANNATERAFCTNDGCTEHDTREVPNTKRDHKPVVIDEIPATCTSTGWTEWSYCEHCNDILTTKQIIPQLSYHTWDEGRLDGIDCEHSDLIYTCVGCGTTQTVDIEDTVDNHTIVVSSKAATYFAAGYKNRKTCTACGKVVSKGTTVAKKVLKAPTVKYTAVKGKKIKVKYTKVTDATGFQVRYKVKGAKKWTVKKFTSAKSKTVYLKSLKAGKKYYVQTRAFVKSGSKTAYGKWSAQKTITAKK